MIEFQSLQLLPDLTGALYIPAYQTLLVADLHFEKGSSLARFGLVIPPFDTRSTLDALEDAMALYHPQTLISLGDSFHDTNGHDRMEQPQRKRIDVLADKTDLLWITGNHDPDLPQELPGKVANEICLGPLTLRHEPTINASGEICGHLHPAAIVKQRGRRLRRKCFATNNNRLFMPAFGAYTGALNVTDKAFKPYWQERDFQVFMLGRTAIYPFPSRVLL